MKIKQVKASKNSSVITVDENDYVVSNTVIVKYKLKKGTEITEAELSKLLQESECRLCKDYLFSLIAKYLKTEKGYKDKLYSKSFSKTAVDAALASAKEYGYINDEKYSKAYLSANKNKKSLLIIKSNLMSKGIQKNIIEKILQDEPVETEAAAAKKVFEKWTKNNNFNQENKNKAIRHLMQKGFSYETITKIINNANNQ